MKTLFQPDGSSLCGQTCVAMIADISLEESIRIFETKSATTTKQVAKALRSLGFEVEDRLTRIKDKPKPEFCIVKLHFDFTKRTHWVIWKDGVYIDPEWGIVVEYSKHVRETSYLEIKTRNS